MSFQGADERFGEEFIEFDCVKSSLIFPGPGEGMFGEGSPNN